MTLEPPTLSQEGNDYICTWASERIRITVRDLTNSRDGPRGELEAVSLDAGHLHGGMLNLLSTSGRQALVKELQPRDAALSWKDMIEQASMLVLKAWRAGSPLVLLEPRLRPAADAWAVAGMIPLNVPTLLFGDGGAGKSYLAGAIARALTLGEPFLGMACRPMTVAYLDWEWDEEEHADRLYRLGGDAAFMYRQCSQTLAAEVRNLGRLLDRNGADFIIVDSLGYACGGDITQAEPVLACFSALRQLGRTSLIVHHVPKGKKEPYGSTYVRNSVRSAWYMVASTLPEEDGFTAALRHDKTNRGQRLPSWGVRFRFGEESAALEPTSSQTVTELGDSPKARILEALRGATGLTLGDLAVAVGMEDELPKLSVHLSQLKKQIRVVDHNGVWTLVERRRAEGES